LNKVRVAPNTARQRYSSKPKATTTTPGKQKSRRKVVVFVDEMLKPSISALLKKLILEASDIGSLNFDLL